MVSIWEPAELFQVFNKYLLNKLITKPRERDKYRNAKERQKHTLMCLEKIQVVQHDWGMWVKLEESTAI